MQPVATYFMYELENENNEVQLTRCCKERERGKKTEITINSMWT